ncbi:MAG: phosphoribosylamine--glycine ligase [Candidatus Micrarchaeia archaeon]|jgi:phosphoribosylamine--glycine ligase
MRMVRVLLVGSGGREHALADALSRSDKCELFSFMSSKNPGIARLSKEFVVGDINDIASVVKLAKSKRAEVAVVGPEAPLEKGLADELVKNEILTCSPSRAAARIEWDKSYARSLMHQHKIPGSPKFHIAKTARDAAEAIDGLNGNVAVKPAGLTAGKGVKVTGVQLKNGEEAKKYAADVLSANIGKLGAVVIEEKLEGEEFTLQCFVTDGQVHPMPLVQDHKLAFEGDKGPNTGGMGSYSDANNLLPFLQPKERDDALEIVKSVVSALSRDGALYRGVLYGQFIATNCGVKVIEFNARFGDPEAMNVLPLLEGDFAEIAGRMGEGALARDEMKFAQKASVCKYLVPEGYPDKPLKGEEVVIDEKAIANAGSRIFYSSIGEEKGKLVMLGSRTAAIVGHGETIAEAEKKAEAACSFVKGKLFHRRDIGTGALVNKRIAHMRLLRGEK